MSQILINPNNSKNTNKNSYYNTNNNSNNLIHFNNSSANNSINLIQNNFNVGGSNIVPTPGSNKTKSKQKVVINQNAKNK